ncbi:MAG: hypothetical protein V4660_06345 [Pseudomonadota bacterium]
MRKIIAILMMGFSLGSVCVSVIAQQLPRFGTISIRTNFKSVGTATQTAGEHWQSQGMVMGTAFNDKGEGPLHLGPTNCSGTFFVVGTRGKGMGFCTFGDADGDKFFVQYTGDYASSGASAGINEIIGGTGKYLGIQGKGPFKCKPAGAGGELQCTEKFDYQLP